MLRVISIIIFEAKSRTPVLVFKVSWSLTNIIMMCNGTMFITFERFRYFGIRAIVTGYTISTPSPNKISQVKLTLTFKVTIKCQAASRLKYGNKSNLLFQQW